MPLLAEDPNLAVLPDFRTEEYAAARAHLTSDTVDEEQAAKLLAGLWHTQNQADRQHWEARLAEEAQAAKENRRRAVEEEAERHQAAIKDQEAVISEELEEVSCSSFTADADALIMITSADGLHKWIPAGVAQDPKAQVIKDDNLTWEQFNEAAPCMIVSMKENDWPEDWIDMHVAFWSALQNHRWCHAFNTHKQWALLLYQAQQRCCWHLSVGSSNSWSLARINQPLLDKVHEEVFKQFRIQELAVALQKAAIV
ncbi:hypothetical protein BD769DRAFT_1771727 [Suillus cothurnatus]|nr:hypothetical protein BD769DRAFT_1771727 [Suillus cothurnatus]